MDIAMQPNNGMPDAPLPCQLYPVRLSFCRRASIVLLLPALLVTCRGRFASSADRQVSPQSVWRLGYVNADVLTASAFPFSYYTHVVLLGLNCNGRGRLYNEWGYRTANWRAYRVAATHHDVKLMLLVGGDMASCTASGQLASYVNNIASVVNGTDNTLNAGGVMFDGVTLDWERGMSASIAEQYERLISTLRSVLGPAKLITVDGWTASFFRTIILNQQDHLDRFNNEMYDSAVNGAASSSGQKWSWYNMANRSVDSRNSGSAEAGFTYYVAAGFPASKINEGIPYYGYLYSGCTHSKVVGCSASRTQYPYKDIRNNATWWNTPHLYDLENGSDYISFAVLNQYLSYTDTDQLRALTTWGNSVHLGGYFTWEVDFETLTAVTRAQQFPLSFALFSDTTMSPTSASLRRGIGKTVSPSLQ